MQTRQSILRGLVAATFVSAICIARAGILTYEPITGDADSGISSLLNYTAKADFFGSGSRVVNGVSFTDTGASGTGYTLSGPGNTLSGGNPNFVTGEVGGLVTDFFFGGVDGNSTLELSGLTPGQQYTTSWFNRGWGPVGGRVMLMTASDAPGGVYRFDQNFTGDGNGNVIRYTFTASATTQTFAFDPASNGDSFHHYSVTNAVRNDGVVSLVNKPVAPRIVTLAGPGPVSPPGVLSGDLLETAAIGLTTSGTFATEGTGGIAALTNGTFTADTGGFSEFFTPNAGFTMTVDLNLGAAPLGYDISSIRGFGGWQDGGRDRQNYTLYYSLVGSSVFSLLGTVDFDIPNPGTPSTITSTFDTALTGVDALRIEFGTPQENGHAGYGEFDVVGTATVPEPGSALLLLAAAPFVMRRRRG